MDDPSLDEDRHVQALHGLARLNRLSRTARQFWSYLRREPHAADPLRILDVACGGGDIALDLACRFRAVGRGVQVDGCDLSPRAVRLASDSAGRRGIGSRFFLLDALREPIPPGYDVLITSLFLHHLDNPDVVAVLANMAAGAGRGILVSDLERTRKGYCLAWLATRAVSRSRVVHYDGPVSVQAAFRRDEIGVLAEQAGLRGATVRRVWPERFQLEWKRQDSG